MLKILFMLFLTLLTLALITLIWGFLHSYFLFKKTLILEEHIRPYSRDIPNATMKILVLGDSTAVGTGATDSSHSTAGRLGELYPDASVTTLAVNGLKIAGLLDILATRDAEKNTATHTKEHFDLVLIQMGANDIIRLTSMKDIDAGIARILEHAQQFGGQVIVIHSGDIGSSHFFPWFVRPILSHRSYKVLDLYIKEAALHGASYVDIIASDISKQIESDPARYYSADKLHLSDDGYGLWFQEIKKVISLTNP